MLHISPRTRAILASSALLVGSTVGAGIFALPFVISKSGFFIGLAYLVIITLVSLYVNLVYGETILSTLGKHQFPAYVNKYLGRNWRLVALITLFVQFYGALAAYMIEVGNLLSVIFGPIFGGSELTYAILFFVVMSAALFYGLKAVSVIEQLLVLSIIVLVVIFCVIAVPLVNPEHFLTYNFSYALLPYGVVLFAFGGAGAIVDMSEIVKKHKRDLKITITIGTVVPFILYTAFVLAVVGITGVNTTESSVVGLGEVLGPAALYVGSIFGVLSMSTSFLLLGLILREVYQYDLFWKPVHAWLAAVIPPLLILLLGLFSFVEILGVTGAITGGITGVIFIKMHEKVKTMADRKAEYSISQSTLFHNTIIGLFVLGIVYEIYIAVSNYM